MTGQRLSITRGIPSIASAVDAQSVRLSDLEYMALAVDKVDNS